MRRGSLGHRTRTCCSMPSWTPFWEAAALGDIGRHFPDTDEAYRGASSLKLLEKVGELIEKELYVISNIDATIIAQRPKLAPYIDAMRDHVADTLHLERNQVTSRRLRRRGLASPEAARALQPRRPPAWRPSPT